MGLEECPASLKNNLVSGLQYVCSYFATTRGGGTAQHAFVSSPGGGQDMTQDLLLCEPDDGEVGFDAPVPPLLAAAEGFGEEEADAWAGSE